MQCSIPVFDGLLPEPHNTVILQLLFTMAHWHGLAKLRMHSDLTLDIMDQVTSAVAQQFRNFKAKVCSAYKTHELSQEVEARARQNAKKAAKHKGKQAACVTEQVEALGSDNVVKNVRKKRFLISRRTSSMPWGIMYQQSVGTVRPILTAPNQSVLSFIFGLS